jgi:uncharacterized protein YjbI with pentapeptide repeats
VVCPCAGPSWSSSALGLAARRSGTAQMGDVGRPRRDWIQISVSSLPGLAAVIALVFTSLSIKATNDQLRENRLQLSITEQGQLTDRFNAAISNLSSANPVIQLGGIYALQRIMQDSTRDQPFVINVISAYIRLHAPMPQTPILPSAATSPTSRPSVGVQAALEALANRNPSHDRWAKVNLAHTDLAGAYLFQANLSRANLTGALLARADLDRAQLFDTKLTGANLYRASLVNANLSCTKNTSTLGMPPCKLDLAGADFNLAQMAYAQLEYEESAGVNLRKAKMIHADLSGTNFRRSDVRADLRRANLSGAIMKNSDIRGAIMIDANITGTVFGPNQLATTCRVSACIPRWARR